MEETLQQEKQESEYVNPNEDKGGIGRRLRDRDLLRKRKAEAEEKETNQWVLGVESQRKRPRAAGDRSGTKRRGRPRKNEPALELSVTQEEAAVPEEAPAVVVVPEPAEVIPDQTLAAVEAPAVPVLAAPAPQLVFGSLENPLFSPAPFISTPALFSPSVPAPAPAKDLDRAPNPFQDVAPAPDDVPAPTSTQAPDPAAAPAPSTAPSKVGALYAAVQGREAPNQVLIEDVGPDEDEDIPPSQDKRGDEDLNGTPLINVPEQNKMFSVPTLSSTPPTQEYLPGNSY